MTILLSVLTLFNLITLVVMASLLAEAAEQGGLDDKQGTVLMIGLLLCVIGLVGIGGAWSTRKWGPRLYLAAVVVDRLITLIAYPDFFSPVLLIGVALAIALVGISENNR